MNLEEKIRKVLYENSTDCSDGMIIDFDNIQLVIQLITQICLNEIK